MIWNLGISIIELAVGVRVGTECIWHGFMLTFSTMTIALVTSCHKMTVVIRVQSLSSSNVLSPFLNLLFEMESSPAIYGLLALI